MRRARSDLWGVKFFWANSDAPNREDLTVNFESVNLPIADPSANSAVSAPEPITLSMVLPSPVAVRTVSSALPDQAAMVSG